MVPGVSSFTGNHVSVVIPWMTPFPKSTVGDVPTTQKYRTVAVPAGIPADQSRLAEFCPVAVPITFIGVPGVMQIEPPLVVNHAEVP